VSEILHDTGKSVFVMIEGLSTDTAWYWKVCI